MKHHVTLYTSAPEFDGRFADIRYRMDTLDRWERWLHAAAIVLGAATGVVIAWAVM